MTCISRKIENTKPMRAFCSKYLRSIYVFQILENKDSTEMYISAKRTDDTLRLKNSTAKSEGSGCCRR